MHFGICVPCVLDVLHTLRHIPQQSVIYSFVTGIIVLGRDLKKKPKKC